MNNYIDGTLIRVSSTTWHDRDCVAIMDDEIGEVALIPRASVPALIEALQKEIQQ